MERLHDESSTITATTTPTGPPGIAPRVVFINGGIQKFCSNKITTAKYNVFSFLPKFLFEQFRRYSNIFFLFIALMQQIPDVSPTGRYTTAVPLFCILSVSALKEIFEDIKRHRADRGVNRSKTLVLNRTTLKWEQRHWYQVCVGDVVKVTNDHFFPSDLLLLASSEPNGMCYIETANLDGETNLKIRQSLAATFECVTSEKIKNELNGASIECEPPNKHLYEFRGNLKHDDRIYNVTTDQILLRGAKLKNCNWVFGCVLYTGHETKLMMNSMLQSPLKQSQVDKVTNTHIVSLFMILIAIGAISAIASYFWNKENTHWYVQSIEDISSNPLFTFLTFIILYNNLIPISLQVTLEVVRFIQAHFINSDLEMYDDDSDTPAMARTSNLNEELGQVRYILSDKTGTLTRNVMEFKKCTVAGTLYEEYESSKMVQVVQGSQSQDQLFMREFLTLLAVCHTVVPELDDNGDQSTDGDRIKYQAASPDEGALVKAAAEIGFKFTTRTPQHVYISALGQQEQYEVLNVLEFTSDRKRMSVIVRCPNGKIKLYTKGADTVITERLMETANDTIVDQTMNHLETFAILGLRTLCCAYSLIEEKDYNEWNQKYLQALTSDMSSRENNILEAMSQIESNLTLLGATAVEDKLQEGVPESINTFLEAGINVWVLTGDKKETAINIGFSCKLLRHGMQIEVISEESLDATREAIRRIISTRNKDGDSALIIDGKTLKYALASDIKMDLMELALTCRSVICCRVSPIQKAEIVELVKFKTKEVTLAIGDGANDVAMIRAANVGIGISGQEGLQAAHSADYSIAQFRFLTRLLLVHGSWSLSRLCKLILYSFYKNIALYVIELWFATVSAWSGQTIFERWTIGLYNVIFTAAPPLAIGLFDRQCSAETMLKYPKLYRSFGDQFSTRLFWVWIWSAILHSLSLFWLTYFLVANDTLWGNGLADGGYLVFGNMLYTFVVITVCLKAALEMNCWTWITHAAIWGSIAMWFFFLLVYSHFWPTIPLAPDMAGMDTLIYTSGVFWMGIFVIPLLTLMVDIVYKIISRTCFRSLADQLIDEANTRSRSVTASPSDQSLLTETARLIRNVFESTRRRTKSDSRNSREMPHRADSTQVELRGYAFSQEERGAVPQSEVIRKYDTTKAKPSGV